MASSCLFEQPQMAKARWMGDSPIIHPMGRMDSDCCAHIAWPWRVWTMLSSFGIMDGSQPNGMAMWIRRV